ncbi:nidogen-like domain-containing protein [Micromonospora sp. RTP1Z1]|uniref:nidogen-like domain-containing protein n=1 Tax=Micromonospora sp. RTP1Z1 TaxID=2994043 RepID=UPI0029C66EE9|nr:nidogen-like domain-containing protein [Micromonospora sp. RTP1Z1]
MMRSGFPGSSTLDTVTLYDLNADRQVYQSSVTAGFAAAFSPHGRWFFLNVLNGPGNAQIDVIDSVTGALALDTTVIFSNVPGSPGDQYGSVGTGFSSGADDRSFVWAYRTTNGTVELNVRNLATRANVVSTTVNTAAFWRFSPCGDAFGLVTQPNATTASVRLSRTASIGYLGTEKTFSPLPADIAFNTTSTQHQVKTTASNGTVTPTNIVANTAGTACTAAPALSSVTLDRTTAVGGTQNANGTITLTAPAATSGFPVTLTSSDTSAATVQASVTVASEATTRTFTVTTKSVTATKTVTITATAAGVSRTATLTVTPATATPRVASLSLASPSVSGGATTTATVNLSSAAPSTGATVTLSRTGPVTVPATLLVPAGQTSGQLTVATSTVTADTPATVTATAGGGSATANLTVLAQQTTSPNAVVSDDACRAATLPANDDGSAGPVQLPFTANFFGHQYGYLYVNNNGNVTFNNPMSTFTPFRITSSTPPIIAPFFADVDTRGSGSGLVTYSTNDRPATFAGRPAFCVNWINVGYYSSQTDKLNSFQLLLVDRSDIAAGDFDIVMNYDTTRWETGSASGGSNGFGGNSAGAGYSAGTGNPSQFFEFPGTLVPGSLLDNNASTGLTRTSRGTLQLGRDIFEVRNGAAPTGGTVTGTVTDNASPANPLAGAPVQVCPVAGGLCAALTLTGSNGRYQATGVPAGSYLVTATPPAGSTLNRGTAGPVTVSAGETTTQDIVLDGPTPPPAGTTISPSTTNGQGIPTVYWQNPLDLDTTGCVGGQASYQVVQNGTAIASGAMTEGPDGHYTAQIPPLWPEHGDAQVKIHIDCPTGTPDQDVQFDIYIDPSGNVLTLAGNPVPDAVVTLYRSDTSTGSFEQVTAGSAVMSPSNRQNPDMTDAQGHFGWDVIVGYYKVRAQRDGCTGPDGAAYVETAVLTVPPPVTDLDLRLDCPDLDARDTDPPMVTATPDRSANTAGWYNAPVTVVIAATDPGDDASGVADITVTSTGAATGSTTYPGDRAQVRVAAQGVTTLTYTATDAAGNTSQPQSLVVRIDTVAPSVQCSADPAALWPPNHTPRDVTVTVTVSDSGSGPAGFTLKSASSNEPDNGLGDGDTAGDIQGWATGTSDTTGQLRAERSGSGSGRTYTLSYQAMDLAGNSTTCAALVTVPKSQDR